MSPEDTASDRVRLDVWLDVVCLFKTRSEAQRACRGGKVDVNNQRAKPHRTVQTGDRLAITRPNGRTQQVVVRSLTTQHVPRATAKTLYDDVTPRADRGGARAIPAGWRTERSRTATGPHRGWDEPEHA